MMGLVIDILGTLGLLFGWAIIIYALWRNQRVAKKSPKVDKTNPVPRISAIWEVTTHPDRAATWLRSRQLGEEPSLEDYNDDKLTLVFPALSQDLSEQTGVREDDGRTT
jgi:hypothetical protein